MTSLDKEGPLPRLSYSSGDEAFDGIKEENSRRLFDALSFLREPPPISAFVDFSMEVMGASGLCESLKASSRDFSPSKSITVNEAGSITSD
jgi:hypothetical protein